ncbi:Protein kinase-like domain protein [Niveomyces insectorum RCEF 264]|uniref:Protein kinase-like domain protein n=1 Tax=Niveomyces insectorum RCEF 264 TaxID=1081102 RepID=A0A167YNN2_9HYPO|nr:Protein kinase-like domain protein [Niveomyces insectorum RCEF 264]
MAEELTYNLSDKMSDQEILQILESSAGKGRNGLLTVAPCGTRVVKNVVPWATDRDQRSQRKHLRNEIKVYQHLPAGHPRLVRLLDHQDDGTDDGAVSLTLEYMPNNSLKRYLVGGSMYDSNIPDADLARGAAIPLRQRASWALEATDGVFMLHAHEVIHADIKPENMVLDAHLHLRIIDLEGCSLRGAPPLMLESSAFYMPRTPAARVVEGLDCSVTTDLFALGSSIYQIVTGHQPWHQMRRWGIKDGDDTIEARYERGEFPALTVEATGAPLLFADIIWRCWHGQMETAADVLAALKADVRAAFGPEDQAWIERQSGLSLRADGEAEERKAAEQP